MAVNPIQKKVRNAALIGSLATLVIMSVVVAFLLMQLDKIKKEQEEVKNSYRTVYTLGQNVKSGQIITEDMLQLSIAQIQHIPNNATSDIATFVDYSLTDSEGNRVYSDEQGTYLLRNCEYMELYRGDENKYYTYLSDGQKKEVTVLSERDIHEDADGMFLIQQTEAKTRLYKEDATGEYYILRIKYDTNANREPVREKEYVEILGVPLVAKIDMNVNTVVTVEMLARGELLGDDVRRQEYNAIVLPVDLTTGDYVDIRVQFPNGQDFIVVSKKEVEIPVVEGIDSETSIWMNLSEEEILMLSCAMVEAYRIDGTRLYATKYTDPGMQEESVPTYPINAETFALVKSNPNVAAEAEANLEERYTEALVNIRNNVINKELEKEQNAETNVPGKMNEGIVKTQEERKKYLQSLTGEVAY